MGMMDLEIRGCPSSGPEGHDYLMTSVQRRARSRRVRLIPRSLSWWGQSQVTGAKGRTADSAGTLWPIQAYPAEQGRGGSEGRQRSRSTNGGGVGPVWTARTGGRRGFVREGLSSRGAGV